MKKNDKIIVVFGVVILILASIGIYYWVPESEKVKKLSEENVLDIKGSIVNPPTGVTVTDECMFYPLIVTPITCYYNEKNEQHLTPLYIEKLNEPSSAVVRARDMIGFKVNEIIDSGSAKEVSLNIAKKYWETSDGVLLIESTQEGYNLGVIATPLASYLSIPVVVTDKVDSEVKGVLEDLGVTASFICGDLDGYGDVLKFKNVDEIVDLLIDVIRDKFDEEVNYITIANPIDTYTPEVLEDAEVEAFSQTISGGSFLPSQLGSALKNVNALLGGGIQIGSFTIPDDYKYALVKFYGTVEYDAPENPDEMGSSVKFEINGPDDTIFGSGLNTAAGGVSVRDSNGNIIKDEVYSETVLYDRGETEYKLLAQPVLFATTSCKVDVTITMEKLNDSLYPMMKGLSSLAPYLASYHKGIVFGKPEFAFVADDEVRTTRDETCPGPYQPRLNAPLIYPSNQRVMGIHDQINELLAKLADINIDELGALKDLREYYMSSPVYIALVGDAVVLPQIIYKNVFSIEGDWIALHYGFGIPTDVIYGNIDPVENDFSSQPQDMYTEFSQQENIVGRIVGWDVQDASALIARDIFYANIIDDLGDWKDKATVHTGCGTDFLEPPLAGLLNKYLRKSEEPVKWPSGCTNIAGDRLAYEVLEPLGFDVLRLKNTYSARVGFSDDAINTIRKTNILSKILFSPLQVKLFLGEQRVKGAETMEESNIIWQNGHGMPHLYGLGDIAVNPLGWRFFPLLMHYLARTTPLPVQTALGNLGSYNTRSVEYLNLGPSVTIVESCFTGKIDGLYPKSAICLAHLHAGEAAYIASTTETNVPGGYLEPYYNWDRYNIIGNIVSRSNVRKGIYPDPYFGQLLESDFYKFLGEDKDVGTALRDARNDYLEQDWDKTFEWVPPLESTDGASSGHLMVKTDSEGTNANAPDNKYMSYLGYQLYGDPAFNPYIPNEE